MSRSSDHSIRFSRAIVRPPGLSFAEGLTTAALGSPVLEKALEQHERYCSALGRCGLEIVRLEPDPRFPDSTFVEDTAVLAQGLAVIARPGAESRRGEAAWTRSALERRFPRVREIEPPGTLDGGDVCRAGDRFFIGISARTNDEGARQLAGFLAGEGYASTFVDTRNTAGLLHLKSGVAYLGEGRLLLGDELAGEPAFAGLEIVRVPAGEAYAANCVRVNEWILVAAGFPGTRSAIEKAGLRAIELDMSEFRKMDGGLSCLSLRF